jgi:hypothetical protein
MKIPDRVYRYRSLDAALLDREMSPLRDAIGDFRACRVGGEASFLDGNFGKAPHGPLPFDTEHPVAKIAGAIRPKAAPANIALCCPER